MAIIKEEQTVVTIKKVSGVISVNYSSALESEADSGFTSDVNREMTDLAGADLTKMTDAFNVVIADITAKDL